MSIELVQQLIATLRGAGIRYCHWKSNWRLAADLAHGDELDLLVDRRDAQRFEAVLAELGFKQAAEQLQTPMPGVLHYYGMDHATTQLLHLHIYYHVITGESVLKNYQLPLDAPLLAGGRTIGGVPAPMARVELVVFTIRAMAKHAALPELLLLLRGGGAGYAALREELAALLAGECAGSYPEVLAAWLPAIDPLLFGQCIAALHDDAPLLRRVRLARRLGRQLRAYQRFGPVTAARLRVGLFARRSMRRLRRAGKSKHLASGGALVAFVGPEATGKSTLVSATARWLGQAFEVETAHLGKPPATWLTALPNLALPLLRRAAPGQRMSRVTQSEPEAAPRTPSLLYAVRSVLLAWDRRALARKLRRQAANGALVVCDRYPTAQVGAMDSARLPAVANDQQMRGSPRRERLVGRLARIEQWIYRHIPAPDLVIRLTVPVEVAIERNRERIKRGKESDAYVLHRHTSGVVPAYPSAITIELDVNQEREQTIAEARRIMWDAL